MYEARITYTDGINVRPYIIEAGNLEVLKEKCNAWINGVNVAEIQVMLVEEIGWLKSEVPNYVKML